MLQFPQTHRKEFYIFKDLNSPSKVQDFINGIAINFERKRTTCRSPLMVLKRKEAQCIEGALLAAAIFWYHGQKPLLLDLKTTSEDVGHVVALFKKGSHWGAVSKTNHSSLRYRDPVYRSIRELALSYFNEYFLDNGRKTLRSYSKPFNLLDYDLEWLNSRRNLWGIVEDIDKSKHFKIVGSNQKAVFRLADKIEIKAGNIREWTKNQRRMFW